MATTVSSATPAASTPSIYLREKNNSKWMYSRVETGKGHKTGHLTGPFYSRPFTINGKGKRAQVWNRLTATNFEAAQSEAALGVVGFTAKSNGLSLAEAQQVSTGNRVLITEAIAKYLDQKRKLAPRSLTNYVFILNQFLDWLATDATHVRFVDQLDNERDNVLDRYMRHLEELGAEPRTIRNKLSVICFMLKKRRNFSGGIETPSKIVELPRVEVETAVPYTKDELKTIFSAATLDESVTFQFFLDTACREAEASLVEWSDVDWTKSTYRVHAKSWVSNYTGKTKNFTVKNHETRVVPISKTLLTLLKARKADKNSNARWIFPNSGGDPDGHHLRHFKKLVYRAGLNCGHCHQDEWGEGVTCATKPEGCEKHFLHRLRKSCATFWHHQGVPVRTIQQFLAHKSLATTQIYLGVLSTDELQEQLNVPKF